MAINSTILAEQRALISKGATNINGSPLRADGILGRNTLAARTKYGGSSVTTEQIKPGAVVDVAGSTTTPTDTGAGLVAGATTTQQDMQKYLDLANKPTDSQNSFDTVLAQLTASSEGLQGRGASQLSAEQQTGAIQGNKELADLNAQLLSKTAGYDKLSKDLEVGTRGNGNTDIRASMLYGQQGAINRAAAADVGLLQAQILGKQGQVKAAQDAANRAVDLMYQDREAAYNTKLNQYNLIKDKLTGEQKKQGEALAYALDKEKTAIADEKQTKKNVQSLAIDAGKNGAPSNVVSKIAQAKSFEEAANLIAPYLVSPADKLDLQLKRLQIAKAGKDLRGDNDSNKLLSIKDAQDLGVPFGTTQGQAIALQGKTKPLSDLQNNALTSARSLLDQFESGTKLVGGVPTGTIPVGGSKIGINLPGSKRKDFIVNFDNLKSLLSLDNVKLLKGQGSVSDAERQLLRDASSRLNRNQSQTEFKKNLKSIIDVFEKASPEYQYSSAVTNLIQPEDAYSTYTSNLLTQ